jgi:hypothetical protein
MKDYSKYSMEQLQRMSNEAFSQYYKLATSPCGTPPKKSELNRLQKATDNYEEIRIEIAKRLGLEDNDDIAR